jgi:hypothetical protein
MLFSAHSTGGFYRIIPCFTLVWKIHTKNPWKTKHFVGWNKRGYRKPENDLSLRRLEFMLRSLEWKCHSRIPSQQFTSEWFTSVLEVICSLVFKFSWAHILDQRRWTWTGDFKCREVKTGFCRIRSMQTGSSGTLIGWKSGQTTFVPLWDWMEGAWLRTLKKTLPKRSSYCSVQHIEQSKCIKN